MRGLAGKRVLITGGTSGIGLATAARFLREGARVHVCGRSEDQLKQAVVHLGPFGGATGSVCDVGSEGDVERLISEAVAALGAIDILLNNAGVASAEPFLEVTPEQWDHVLRVNARGTFLVSQAVARHLVSRSAGGVIVNMSSTNGLVGEELYAPYDASKGAVAQLTKTMALELGRHGIRVNALCPGYIVTPMSEAIDDPAFVAEYIERRIPLGRTGTVEDVAAAYAFLASDDAAFIHGTTLVIDGGQLAS
jgi:3-oxoacyl-[acyl-carrier protein] reductase